MLDPRLFRAALLPVLLVLIVVAFSLEDRPGPLRSAFAPDVFDGDRAAALLGRLDRDHPSRRAGSEGDAALAGTVAGELDAALQRRVEVRTRTFRGETLDGERELLSVTAQEPGSSPRPQIVLVAQRDSARPGARADLSGTAALIEIARAIAASRPSRTITLASISGASGGQAGMRDLLRSLPRPIDAVIEIGDLAGDPGDRRIVVGWSASGGAAPIRLQRTVSLAVRREAVVAPGLPLARTQLARFALPQPVSGQSIPLAEGVAAIRLSLGGELPTPAGTKVAAKRLEIFGRATLRVLDALDGPLPAGSPTRDLAVSKKILPGWALRLLVAALLLPAGLMAGDAAARLRRRGDRIGGRLAWVAGLGLPLVAAALLARAMGLAGAVPNLRPAPPPGAVPLDGSAWIAMACCAAIAALSAVLIRPWLARRRVAEDLPGEPTTALAVLLVTLALAFVAWVVNPYAALLLVLPVNLWVLLAVVRLRRWLSLAVVLTSLAPVAMVFGIYASELSMSPGEAAWFWTLAVAGGGISVPLALGWSLGGGAVAAALLLALRAPSPDDERPVTVRGPLTYAGPGSLGGTDSALRR